MHNPMLGDNAMIQRHSVNHAASAAKRNKLITFLQNAQSDRVTMKHDMVSSPTCVNMIDGQSTGELESRLSDVESALTCT